MVEKILLIASVLTALGVIVATSTSPTNVSGTVHNTTINTLDANGVIYG